MRGEHVSDGGGSNVAGALDRVGKGATGNVQRRRLPERGRSTHGRPLSCRGGEAAKAEHDESEEDRAKASAKAEAGNLSEIRYGEKGKGRRPGGPKGGGPGRTLAAPKPEMIRGPGTRSVGRKGQGREGVLAQAGQMGMERGGRVDRHHGGETPTTGAGLKGDPPLPRARYRRPSGEGSPGLGEHTSKLPRGERNRKIGHREVGTPREAGDGDRARGGGWITPPPVTGPSKSHGGTVHREPMSPVVLTGVVDPRVEDLDRQEIEPGDGREGIDHRDSGQRARDRGPGARTRPGARRQAREGARRRPGRGGIRGTRTRSRRRGR